MRQSHYTAMAQGCAACGITVCWATQPEYWLWALLGYTVAFFLLALIGRKERKDEARIDACARTAWNFDLDAAPLDDSRMLVLLREPMDNPWCALVVVARFDPAIGFWLTDSGRRVDPPLAWQPIPAALEIP